MTRSTRKFEVRVWPTSDSGPGGGDYADGARTRVRGAVRDVANGVERVFHDPASMLVLLRQALDRHTDRW